MTQPKPREEGGVKPLSPERFLAVEGFADSRAHSSTAIAELIARYVEYLKSFKPTYPVGVSVLVTDKWGKFLMARRKNNDGSGMISTPGGRVELGEKLLDTARREFKEETGATLGPACIIGWKEHFRFGSHYFMFYVHAKTYTGEIQNLIPDKSEDWDWYLFQSLTEQNCTEPQDILLRALNGNPTEHFGTHLSSCAFRINGVTACNCGFWAAMDKYL